MSRPPDTLAGLPFRDARAILRRLLSGNFTPEQFNRIAGGRGRFEAFRDAGLVAPSGEVWTLSPRGAQFSGKLLRRISPEQLAELKGKMLTGVKGVSGDASIPFEVERLAFFGSAISAEPQDDYGDLDCAMRIAYKRSYPNRLAAMEALRKTSNHLDYYGRANPAEEVKRKLKEHGRFRSHVSIVNLDLVEDNGWPYQLVYIRP